MQRRKFLKDSALLGSGGFLIMKDIFSADETPVYGHNEMKYRMEKNWSRADPLINPVKDCHEMVQDEKGRIILLTNETKNNVLIFDSSGKLLKYWGDAFPGAHGLTLAGDTFFITDHNRHQVYKTSLDGEILMTIDAPAEANLYSKKDLFLPTETAVADGGDFYVADGYGEQYILHYDSKGTLLNYFGGKGEGDSKLDNAHGICIDRRHSKESLLVTDRTRHCFKRFSMEGKLMEIIKLPGACVCRPVIKGTYLYAAVLTSSSLGNAGTGFITILNKDNKVVSNIGGTLPVYKNSGELQSMSQAEKILNHPHDVCVDRDGNVYVAQWASGKVYPYKFKPV